MEAVITTDYLEGKKARYIPGASYSAEHRGWTFDPHRSADAVRVAMRMFPRLRAELPPDAVAAADAIVTDVRPVDLATPWANKRSTEQLLPTVPDELRSTLYPYQVVDVAYAIARLRADGGAYIGWDRGLGKTLGALTVASALQSERTVIVTPNSSKETVWRPEISKWVGDSLGSVYNLGGTKKHRDRMLARWSMDGGVLLAHYEALRLVDWDKLTPAQLVICDEAHRLANGSSSSRAPKFYKALMKIRTKYKLALSGSIVVNGPEDFFGANHWLFPTYYRSKWRDWNDKYIHYIESAFGREAVGVFPHRLDDLRNELAGFMVVRHKQDTLKGLPQRIEQTIRVELSPSQRKVYDELAESFIATLDNGEIILAPSVVAQLVKLRQVACGLDLVGDDMQDSAKLDVAVEMVEDLLPNKSVLFCWHRATVRSLSERLTAKGIVNVTVDGGTPMKHRAERVEQFQTDPATKVIVATIKTLGESVTLHAASDLIFVESSWTPADMDQAADRVYRIGQKNRVTVTHLVAADTLDETLILPRVADKAAMRALVLGGKRG